MRIGQKNPVLQKKVCDTTHIYVLGGSNNIFKYQISKDTTLVLFDTTTIHSNTIQSLWNLTIISLRAGYFIGTVPYYKENTVPYYKEATVPYYKEATVPYYKEATVPYYKEGTVPYCKEAT